MNNDLILFDARDMDWVEVVRGNGDPVGSLLKGEMGWTYFKHGGKIGAGYNKLLPAMIAVRVLEERST